MCRSTALSLSIVLLVGAALALPAADDKRPPDQDNIAPSSTLLSDKAVVKDIVYGLEADGSRLFLTSQPLSSSDRELRRSELKLAIVEGGRIVELSLARLDGKNLMAVVKVRRGDEFDFHCLTFIAPPGGHVRDKHQFHQAKFYTTPKDLAVLAVDGKHHAGSAFIVLGELGLDEGRELGTTTEGVFYFSGCPWPPSGGQLSPFKVKAVASE